MPAALLIDPPLVVVSSDHATVRFAAAELVRYSIAAGAGPLTAVVCDPYIGQLPPPETAGPSDGLTRLWGHGPAELLQAVYGHLGRAGWRWYTPGPLGEAFRPGVPLPAGPPSSSGFAQRLVVDKLAAKEQGPWLSEALRMVDWMGKHGFTGLALETPHLDLLQVDWLAPELSRRGLGLEIGGDIVPWLLAECRGRQVVGERRRVTPRRARRLEVARPEVLAALPEVSASILSGFAPADLLRLAEPGEAPLVLAEDMAEETVPGERLAAAVRAVVDGVGGKVAVWQPVAGSRRGFVPPPEARLILSTDRRALAAPLGSGEDRRNLELLERIAAAAGRDGGLEVATGYADCVALRNLAAPLTRIIAADLRALRDCGAAAVSTVVHGEASWWLCPLNLYVFARCAAAPEVDVGLLVDDWCEGLYGRVARTMRAYLTAFETAMTPLWSLRETAGDRGASDLEALLAAVRALPQVAEPLAAAERDADDPLVQVRLEHERQRFELTNLHAQLWLLRRQAAAAHPTLALHAAARELVGQALHRLAEVPLAVGGVGMRREYRATLDQLAAWGGIRPDEA